MSISGRWTDDAAGTSFGEFSISHDSAEKRFPPSYDLNRIKLYSVLEQLATGGFGVVSRVRRVTDGKILVWKELNYQRMNKKERRMMITEVCDQHTWRVCGSHCFFLSQKKFSKISFQ